MNNVNIRRAKADDVLTILAIQKKAFVIQAELYNDFEMPPMKEQETQIKEDIENQMVLVAELEGQIIGSIRSEIQDDKVEIRRLSVHPDHQRKGIGKKLISAIEQQHKDQNHFWLFTGSKSYDNIQLYKKLGYQLYNQVFYKNKYILVYLEKNLK